MSGRIRDALLISVTVISILFISVLSSYSETINYVYDELSRLIRVEYGDGTIIEYTYDDVGNRITVQGQTSSTAITINSGAASTNSTSVTLTLSCSDADGCSEMQFSNDDVTYSSPEAYATTKAWTLTTGDGTKTVYVKFKDTLGNWSSAYSDTILFDTIPPANPTSCTETHGAPDNTWQTAVSDPAFSWGGASDSGSGMKGYYWYFGADSNGDPTNWTTIAGCDPSAVSPGTYYLRVKTEDSSGNRSSPVTLFTFKYGTGGACASGSVHDPWYWINKVTASGNSIYVAGHSGASGTITLTGGATVSGGLDVSGYPCGPYASDWIHYIMATGNTIQLISYCSRSGAVTLSGATATGGVDARPGGGFSDVIGEGTRIRLISSRGTGFITFSPGCP